MIQTSRFKVRRFGYLTDKLKIATTGTGTLLDESAGGQPTGALHASILNYFDIDIAEQGDPAAGPISGL